MYYTAGSFQPYFNIILGGIILGFFSKDLRLILIFSIVSSLTFTTLYPKIFNLSFLQKTLSVQDPLIYGDVIFKAVFVEIIAKNLMKSDLSHINSFSMFLYSFVLLLILSAAITRIRSVKILSQYKQLKIGQIALHPESLISLGISGVLLLMLILYANTFSYSDFQIRNSYPVASGNYATDYHIYKRTNELMRDQGFNFYYALNEARHGDIRVIKNPEKEYPIPSPLWVQQPFLFYLWKFFGSSSPKGIVFLAAALLFTGLILLFVAFENKLGPGTSIIVLSIVYPFFYLSLGWESLYLPDLWGSLFMMISAGFYALELKKQAFCLVYFLAFQESSSCPGYYLFSFLSS